MAISNIKQSAGNLWLIALPVLHKFYVVFYWIFFEIMFFGTLALSMLGIGLILGFTGNIITFTPINRAVIFYRFNLPRILTKKEIKQVSELKILEKKLNKKSIIYEKSYEKNKMRVFKN